MSYLVKLTVAHDNAFKYVRKKINADSSSHARRQALSGFPDDFKGSIRLSIKQL